jgi:hypothetical protein
MRNLVTGLVLAVATAGCQQQLGSPATVLAQEDPGVQSLAVDGSYVYWTTAAGLVKRLALAGGTPEVVASGQRSADNLVVDDTHVVWSLGDTLAVVEKSSGAVTSFAAQGQVQRLSSDATSLYWTVQDGESGAVNKASKLGQGLTPLATMQSNPLAVSAGLANVLWANTAGSATDASAVLAVPASGGQETLVVSSVDRCVSIATDAGHLYWADAADSVHGTIAMSALDGTNVQTLSTGETNLWSVATDSASVFYSSTDGRLAVVAVTGGAPFPFIAGPAGRVSFALDATNVYWVNENDGAIMTSPKPQAPSASSVVGEGSPIPQ